MNLHFAYADPPYVGMAHKYPEHPDSKRWDKPDAHVDLMREMDDRYDGWALSLHVPSLASIWPKAPGGARLASWVKPFASFKPGVRIAYTWEPVIYKRNAPRRDGDPVGRDHISCNAAMQRGLFGAKHEVFCRWILQLLGWQEGDLVDDLFPGTGVMGRVVNELRLFPL